MTVAGGANASKVPGTDLRLAEVRKSQGLPPEVPAQEYAGRWERARRPMAELGLDAVLVYGSAATADAVRYLSGYLHPFPQASASLVLLPGEGEPVLFIDQPWHLPDARAMSPIEDVRVLPAGGKRWAHGELVAGLREALEGRGLARGRIGLTETWLPAVYLHALQSAAPAAAWDDALPVWGHLVAHPSHFDREMIQATARIADLGLETIGRGARAGVTENELAFRAYAVMAAEGAEFLHGNGASTHVNFGSFSRVISNVRPYLHVERPLEEGQMFWIDLTCHYGGYSIDADRTVATSQPSREQQRIYDVVREMYRAMLEAVRPGLPGQELFEVGYAVAERAGYGDSVNHVYFGHTTGAATSVRPFVIRGEEMGLVEDSYLNIEPGIIVPRVGSACLEDTLLVSADGAEPINRCPREILLPGARAGV